MGFWASLMQHPLAGRATFLDFSHFTARLCTLFSHKKVYCIPLANAWGCSIYYPVLRYLPHLLLSCKTKLISHFFFYSFARNRHPLYVHSWLAFSHCQIQLLPSILVACYLFLLVIGGACLTPAVGLNSKKHHVTIRRPLTLNRCLPFRPLSKRLK